MKFGFVCLMLFLCLAARSLAFADQSYREVAVMNGGTIRGNVTFKGVRPASETIPVSADVGSCGKTKTLSSVEIGPNQGVKNVIVGLQGVSTGKAQERAVHVSLDQLRCEYAPHILIAPRGATIDFVNSDSILHNVHAYDLEAQADPQSGPKTLFNIALPIKGMKIQKPMTQAGLVRLLCDAGHPWMNAYVLLTDHPYFAVTDELGKFEMANVPPGTYTIRMWHEGQAKVDVATKSYKASNPIEASQKVTVTSGGTANVNFTFEINAGK